MKRLLQMIGALAVSCAATVSIAETRPDAVSAVETLEGFFAAFSVEHYPNPEIHDWITDDFLIFEMGQAFDWASFGAFLDDAGYANWLSTEWRFSDIRVSLSGGAAHISYVNEGEFVYPDPENPNQLLRESNRWLESVYLVRKDERVKIKFLQSDNVAREVMPIAHSAP